MLTSKKMASLLILLGLALLLMAFMTAKDAPPPAIQKGEVTVTFDADGVVVMQVPFPRQFRGAPIMQLTPRGEQGFVVAHYFADAFDGTAFVVGAQGEPGTHVTFYWVAFAP